MRRGFRVGEAGPAEAGDVATDSPVDATSAADRRARNEGAGATAGSSGDQPPLFDARGDWTAREERDRFAYRIHDDLTQVVTTAILELEGLAQRIASDPEEAIRTLDATKVEIRKSLDDLRAIMFGLSNGSVPDLHGTGRLVAYARRAAERWKLRSDVSVEGGPRSIPSRVFEAACGVIGESIANSAKHADASSVVVRIAVIGEMLHIEVEDSGRGFAETQTGQGRGHFGLPMMRRRVEQIGGALDIESSPGHGTRVVARLALGDEGEKS
jgi:two-component system, NarL family, sensor histidine kinase DegS